jgi:hypothetical protein
MRCTINPTVSDHNKQPSVSHSAADNNKLSVHPSLISHRNKFQLSHQLANQSQLFNQLSQQTSQNCQALMLLIT